jgi:two-component system, NarL family, response regulator YdfI
VIHVSILAATEEDETALATLLGEDRRFEILDREEERNADVVLIASGRMAPVELRRVPAVILTDDVFEPSDYRTSVRARLPRNVTAGELIAAIAAAAQGLVVLTEQQADSLFAHPTVPQSAPPLVEELTPRELQVLRDVAEGLANKEIAEHLHISEHTVKFHVASVLGKLQVGSRTEAVTQGIRMGLIPI